MIIHKTIDIAPDSKIEIYQFASAFYARLIVDDFTLYDQVTDQKDNTGLYQDAIKCAYKLINGDK